MDAKISSVESSIGNLVTIAPAGVRGFEGGGDPLTTDQLAEVAALPNVVAVTQLLQDRLTSADTNLQSALDLGALGARAQQRAGGAGGAGGPGIFVGPGGTGAGGGTAFTPPIIVVGTNDPTNLQSFAAGADVKLTAGDAFAGTSDENVALVGAGLAAKNSLSVGSKFQAYGAEMTVTGIFAAGANRFADSTLVAPLATVQRLSGLDGAITSAVAQVDSITNLTSTVSAIRTALGDAADVTSQADTSAQALEPLDNIRSVAGFSVVGAVVAGAVIVFLTMLMIVRERRREIGVLKAIGASNFTVMRQFMAEAVTFTALAAGVGLALGVVGGNPVTDLLVNNSTSNAAAPGGLVGPGGVALPRQVGGGQVGGGLVGGGLGGGGLGGGGLGAGAGPGGGGPGLAGPGLGARLAAQGPLNLTDIQVAAGWGVILYGAGAAVVIAVAGSAVPALLMARVRPAEVLRRD